jgi:hypothetical protein
MAAFEWCVKDFIAQVIDATDAFDDLVLERSELNSTLASPSCAAR